MGGHKTISASIPATDPRKNFYTDLWVYYFALSTSSPPPTWLCSLVIPGKASYMWEEYIWPMVGKWNWAHFKNLWLTEDDLKGAWISWVNSGLTYNTGMLCGAYVIAKGIKTQRLDISADKFAINWNYWPAYPSYWDKVRTNYTYPNPADTSSHCNTRTFHAYLAFELSDPT